MKPVQIEVAGEKLAITPGAKRGQDLMNLAQVVAPEQIVLEVDNDVDILVSPTDVIIIRGRERFSVGSGLPQLPDNPTLRNPIGATLNDQPLGHGRHGKATVAELVAWGGGGSRRRACSGRRCQRSIADRSAGRYARSAVAEHRLLRRTSGGWIAGSTKRGIFR